MRKGEQRKLRGPAGETEMEAPGSRGLKRALVAQALRGPLQDFGGEQPEVQKGGGGAETPFPDSLTEGQGKGTNILRNRNPREEF